MLAAILLRLTILPLFYDDYNYWAFGVFTNFLLHGQNPYHIVTQDPTLLNINPWRYPPLYLLFTIPALIAQSVTGQTIASLVVLKTPLAVSDIISSYYLFKILLRSLPHRAALSFCALFAFNPLVIFESSGGGFNDPIAIAFTVASAFYFLKHRDSLLPETRNLFLSALLLGLGIATKIYPLLLTPVFLAELRGSRPRVVYAIGALLPAFIFSIPFLTWDWGSYLQLLTIRNVGGQHPLFPGFELGGFPGAMLFSLLAACLMLVYLLKIPFSSRLALVFLWVNLAIFSTSLNYMVWGIPFFTLYVAEHRRLFLLPLSPMITLIVALVFQGSYNTVGGSAGFFYWTYHILHIPLVLSLKFPWLGALEFLGLAGSETVTGYYFIAIFLRRKGSVRHGAPKLIYSLSKLLPRKSMALPLFLIVLVIAAWTFVGVDATFLPHRYPSVSGSEFIFVDSFRSSLLDYQWVFNGQGNYTLIPEQSTVRISSPPSGTAELYRGWGSITSGFQPSSSAVVTLLFRFDGFAKGSSGMTLINMTDGQLEVQTQNSVSFLYIDQVNKNTVSLLNADNDWHSFTIQYAEGSRLLRVDNSSWRLAGGTFDRLMLGNSNSKSGFGGAADFSDVAVDVNDFSTGFQSSLVSTLAMIVPTMLVTSTFSILRMSQREPEKRTRIRIPTSDTPG